MAINALQWQNIMMQQIQQAQLENQRQMFQQQMLQQQILQQKDDEEESCPEEQRTLFISNLDDTKVDDELLYELFLQAGPLEKVSFPKRKTFAFITYVHSCTVVYAMHLFQGVKLFGSPICIKFNGTTNLPPLTKRLLPPNYDILQPKNPFSDSSQPPRRSFDNSALRNSRFAAFTDSKPCSSDRDRNYSRDRSPQRYSRDHVRDNHRRHDRPPTRRRQDKDFDKNSNHSSDRERSRSHHGGQSYEMRRY